MPPEELLFEPGGAPEEVAAALEVPEAPESESDSESEAESEVEFATDAKARAVRAAWRRTWSRRRRPKSVDDVVSFVPESGPIRIGVRPEWPPPTDVAASAPARGNFRGGAGGVQKKKKRTASPRGVEATDQDSLRRELANYEDTSPPLLRRHSEEPALRHSATWPRFSPGRRDRPAPRTARTFLSCCREDPFSGER